MSLLNRPARSPATGRGRPAARPFVPCLEVLEDRTVPDGVPAPGNSLTVHGLPDASGARGLVQQLVGKNITVSNVRITGTFGADASAGNFTTDNPDAIGITKGVMLASSSLQGVVGNESADPDDIPIGTNQGRPGDPDLNALVGVSAAQAFDATVLEFDFVPKGSFLTFQYIYGSTEYEGRGIPPTNSDAFGIFVNGKVASLVPGTSTSVQTTSVNTDTNSQFFVDNTDDDFSQFGEEFTPHAVTLSGYTTVLTIDVPVNPNVVNHMKIAVQVTGDPTGYAAGFFVDGSLSAGGPLAFKPFRYVFDQSNQTYSGNLSVLQNFVLPLGGPLALALVNVPPHATLLNATGTTVASDGVTVIPVLSVPGVSILEPGQVARVTAVFSNPPPPVFLSTFFEGYTVDILNGAAAAPFS